MLSVEHPASINHALARGTYKKAVMLAGPLAIHVAHYEEPVDG